MSALTEDVSVPFGGAFRSVVPFGGTLLPSVVPFSLLPFDGASVF
jgi:hypothetical protein